MSDYDTDYDWRQAFSYAKDFTLADVDRVEARSPGENDEAAWVAFGALKDGRWFVLRAGCDYTGWDCQASGESETAATREALIELRMSSDDRARLLDGLVMHGWWPGYEVSP